MFTSWPREVGKFKSPVRVVAAFLLRSRETQVQNNQQLRNENEQLQARLAMQARQLQAYQQHIDTWKQRVTELERQLERAKQTVNLPEDPSLGTHGYGAHMISLAVNVARSVGLRGAERVLQLFFKWLKVEQNIPTRTSIRNWLQRLGIAELQRPPNENENENEDLVIMVDHSNQIGTEKVLVVLGVNASTLPPPGTALGHQNVRVLEVKPSSQWKTEDMERQYQALADRHGAPRAVLVDGAVELRAGAKCLKNKRPDTVVLRDFKHYAANLMKSLVGNDPRFQEVGGKIGSTRAAIQQTELAHLTPPSFKQKARFMNLAATIRWLTMIAWLLEHPDARARQGIGEERLREKLGWVERFGDDIAQWQECQTVVSASLTFINEQYLFRGAAQALRGILGDSLKYEKSRKLARRLIDFVAEAEEQLRAGERLPMSTEILESTFGLYKQLERQHSKSGFTSLLACLPALLRPTTPAAVREAFARVGVKDVKAWTQQHLGTTVNSRRQAAYAEHKAALKRATDQGQTV